ncbi:hypothetical protein [Clostridium aminobutyricum]|uniref:Uncharacterized protein n=1 Tax=Clostridium aminobutyricum TaxID=33953 RepID=A0A939II73_CLOAM|nr:hypothetical protein [Clostridium aminobutyricum]MBN7774627.1 hypothetical protein [Clostridium aminobutyricum]
MRQGFSADVARYILYCAPDAIAWIIGIKKYPKLTGKVYFWQMEEGVFLEVEVKGLPDELNDNRNIFNIHILSGQSRAISPEGITFYKENQYDVIQEKDCEMIGNLPPVFSNNGMAWYATLINGFRVADLIGCEISIDGELEDFIVEPSDKNSKLAYGVIRTNNFS